MRAELMFTKQISTQDSQRRTRLDLLGATDVQTKQLFVRIASRVVLVQLQAGLIPASDVQIVRTWRTEKIFGLHCLRHITTD